MRGNYHPINRRPKETPERCISHESNSSRRSRERWHPLQPPASVEVDLGGHLDPPMYIDRDGHHELDRRENTPLEVGLERCIESASLQLSSHSDEDSLGETLYSDDIPIPATPKIHTKKQFSMISCILLFVFVAAAYSLGGGLPASLTVQLKLEKSESALRELIQNQEKLLLQLTKDKRFSAKSSGSDLLERVKQIQDELEATSSALEAEKDRRNEAEHDATTAWDQVSHLSTELGSAETQMHQDQATLYRNLAVQKFGAGPHYAEFTVSLVSKKDTTNSEPKYGSFTIEFASLDIMPVSVFMIMQQLDQGLWDNTSISLNAPHVLMAQPLNTNGEIEKFNAMERMGLSRLPFVEYSERYPHQSYTLGLGGRVLPGPNFFVNKIDNTELHAGQPCFARVITGKETIDAMSAITGDDPADPFYIHPLEIISAKLVHKTEGGRYQPATKTVNSHRSEH